MRKKLLEVDLPNYDEESLGDNFHDFIDRFCGIDTEPSDDSIIRITVERVESEDAG